MNLSEEFVDFDVEEFDKEVKDALGKCMSRVKRNADSILKKGLDISEISEKSTFTKIVFSSLG